MRKLTLVIIIVLVLSIFLVSAVTLYDVAFSDGTTSKQINLVEKTNYTIYIDVPKAYINNITLHFEGIPS